MIPGEFEYYRPASVQEAIQHLGEHGEEARLLAGGHSLVPLMKLRLAAPAALVDLGGIAELRGIERSNGTVGIGAMTTHAAIEHSRELRGILPLLPDAAAVIGDPMVRNRGTIGGSLAHADPAGDWPAIALALDAQLDVEGPNGRRTIPAEEFFVALLTSALEPYEVLTRITVPVPQGTSGMAYQKLRHPASGYAVVGIAAVLMMDGDGACRDCRVAVTGATATASRAHATEELLRGKTLDEESIAAAAERAADGMEFLGDLYASEAYREHLTKVYAKRALLAALTARGGSTASAPTM